MSLPETNTSQMKIGPSQKGNDRIPTIHFSEAKMLVSGKVYYILQHEKLIWWTRLQIEDPEKKKKKHREIDRFIWAHEGSPFICFGPLILRHTPYMGQGNMTLVLPLSVWNPDVALSSLSCWRYRVKHMSLYTQISISLHVHTFLWDKNSEPKYKENKHSSAFRRIRMDTLLLVPGLHLCYVVSWDLQVLFTDHREWKPSNKLTIHH